VKGAFTDARADRNGLFHYAQGGTLFLDEIGDLPLAMQTKLLRVLEERRIRPVGSEREIAVDVRIVAASNRDLAPEVSAGRFRQDLFYRIDVVKLVVPPLRERPEDVLVMARHFVDQLARQLGVPPLAIVPDVAQRLMAYSWPGNARELRNLIERALILGYFPVDSLPMPEANPAGIADALAALPADCTLEQVEKEHILRVLERVRGNKSEAARRLGVSRKTLERKCALWDAEQEP